MGKYGTIPSGRKHFKINTEIMQNDLGVHDSLEAGMQVNK